jgi:hypothetical protein
MKRIAFFSTIIVLLIIGAVQTAEPYLTRVRKRLIEESTIESTTIGATTASTGSFTTLAASGNATIGGTLNVTGATTIAALTGANAGTLANAINNRWVFSENSEEIEFIFGTNKIELGAGSTGVNTIDFNDVDELEDVNDITGDNGQKIDFDINNRIEITENSENLHVIFGTNKVELGTDTGITEVDFNDVDKLSDIEEIDTGTDTFLNVTTNGKDHSYYVIPISYISATEIRVTNGSGNLCVGLAAGADEIGSTEGYTQIDDAADFCRFSFPLPIDFVDTGTQADLIIQFDIAEQAAEECNIDVRLFEYGNTTAILTDTIAIADGAGRGWQSLVTNATGIGNDADIDGDDVLMVEITSTADADDFNLYGCRLTYRVGVEATQ